MNPVILKPLQCVTNAPVDYDWGWTKQLVTNLFTDDRGKSYRLIEVQDQYHFECQIGRYGSGCYNVITDQKSLDHQINMGWLLHNPNPTNHYYSTFDFEDMVEDEAIELMEVLERMELNKKIKMEVHDGGLNYRLCVADETPELFLQLVKNLNRIAVKGYAT